jgi:hypothetical protein
VGQHSTGVDTGDGVLAKEIIFSGDLIDSVDSVAIVPVAHALRADASRLSAVVGPPFANRQTERLQALRSLRALGLDIQGDEELTWLNAERAEITDLSGNARYRYRRQ